MYTRILVALDGSTQSERIIPWVRRLALSARACVHLVRVHPPVKAVVADGRTVAYADQVEAQARTEALEHLRTVGTRLEEDGIRMAMEVRFGDAAEVILATARDTGADLIALATAGGQGIGRWKTKSVTEAVLRRAPVPVLIVRPHDQRAA